MARNASLRRCVMPEIGAGFEQVKFRAVLATKLTGNKKHLFPAQTVTRKDRAVPVDPVECKQPRILSALFWIGSAVVVFLVMCAVEAALVVNVILCRPKLGTVSITSKPEGATVKWHSQPIGKTPLVREAGQILLKSEPVGLSFEIVDPEQKVTSGKTPIMVDNLPIRKYTVRIKRPGWRDYIQEVDLQPNPIVTIDHAFQAVNVTLKSDPAGATIMMGQSELGKTPLTVALPMERIELVSRFGTLEPVMREVIPDPNGSTMVEFKHNYGLLSVRSNRQDSEIIFDGLPLGKAPIEDFLLPGQHQVIARAPNAPDQTRVADIQASQRANLAVNFNTPLQSPVVPKPTPRPTPHNVPRFRNIDQYNQAKAEAHRRLGQQFGTSKKKLESDKDYYDNQIDDSEGAIKDEWKTKRKEAEQRLDQLSRPTWAVHAGIPRSFHFHGTLALASPGPALSSLWKQNIVATVFWVGELPRENDPGNLQSAWDQDWIHTTKTQNPFYVALPYNDVQNGHTKPEAKCIIPWFTTAFVRDGKSVLKDRWVAIRKGHLVCYAQWEDVGPFCADHWQYVFGSERPRPNKNRDAGIDVSPAVRDFLGMTGMDSCDWRFVSDQEIPPGPWKVFVSPEPALPRILEGPDNEFLLPLMNLPTDRK